jgi:hypothetical protein
MEHITVKKPKSQRAFAMSIVVAAWMLSHILQGMTDDRLLRVLILLLVAGPMVLPAVYFETWAITFHKDEIIRNRWGRLRRYTWSDILEVRSFRSQTDGECIRIRFRDGKEFQFRKEDDRAHEAMKLILKHTSIKSR